MPWTGNGMGASVVCEVSSIGVTAFGQTTYPSAWSGIEIPPVTGADPGVATIEHPATRSAGTAIVAIHPRAGPVGDGWEQGASIAAPTLATPAVSAEVPFDDTLVDRGSHGGLSFGTTPDGGPVDRYGPGRPGNSWPLGPTGFRREARAAR